jgi:hypothetical protein
MPKPAWIVLIAAAGLLARGPEVEAQFVGGTVTTLAPRSETRLDITGPDTLLVRSRHDTLRIPYDKVVALEYGQRVSRRYAEAVLISPLLLLSKSRKHFVTVGFTDPEGRQQALVFRVDKSDVRTVLAGLEAKTGRRVEYQDDEARKTGRN